MCNIKLLFDIQKHCQSACPCNFYNMFFHVKHDADFIRRIVKSLFDMN